MVGLHRGEQLLELRSVALGFALLATRKNAQAFFDFSFAIAAHDERQRADRGGDAQEDGCVDDNWCHGSEFRISDCRSIPFTIAIRNPQSAIAFSLSPCFVPGSGLRGGARR